MLQHYQAYGQSSHRYIQKEAFINRKLNLAERDKENVLASTKKLSLKDNTDTLANVWKSLSQGILKIDGENCNLKKWKE